MGGALKDTGVKIEAVSVSKRLTEAPLTVVTSQFGYSAHQEKVMKAQAFQNKDQIQMMSGRKTLEINPPALLVSRIYRMMSTELGVDPDAPVKVVEVPEDEEEADDDKDDKDDDDKDDDDEDKKDDDEKDDKEEL